MLRSWPCGRLSAGVDYRDSPAPAASKPPESTRKRMHCGGRHANLRPIGRTGGPAKSCDREHTHAFQMARRGRGARLHRPGPRPGRQVPALVYDLGGKFDKSFNEAAYNGAERFKAETGVEYREFEIQNEFAARAGAAQLRPATAQSRSSAMSFSHAGAAGEGGGRSSPTRSSPSSTRWSTCRTCARSSSRKHEGSYLVGMLAAMASQDRQGRLRRRHGHPAHPQIRLRLRARA